MYLIIIKTNAHVIVDRIKVIMHGINSIIILQVAIVAGADEKVTDIAFQYGRNLGLAFQLVDDLLDFVSSSEAMGKPAAADLKLGLATAPVLFACEKVRYLYKLIVLN